MLVGSAGARFYPPKRCAEGRNLRWAAHMADDIHLRPMSRSDHQLPQVTRMS